MKKGFLFLCIVIYSLNVNAQNSQLSCDTIVLKNKRQLLVRLDSISADRVFYKKCDTGKANIYNLAQTNILQINKGGLPIVTPDSSQILIDPSPEEGRPERPSWTFIHYLGKKIIVIKKGHRVRLQYVNKDIIRKEKGRLESISDSYVILKSKSGSLVQISKSEIKELTIIRGLGPWALYLGAILIFLAGLIDGILSYNRRGLGGNFDFSSIFPNSNNSTSNQDSSSRDKEVLLLLLVVIVGLILLFSSFPTNIKAPFSEGWQVHSNNLLPESIPQMEVP